MFHPSIRSMCSGAVGTNPGLDRSTRVLTEKRSQLQRFWSSTQENKTRINCLLHVICQTDHANQRFWSSAAMCPPHTARARGQSSFDAQCLPVTGCEPCLTQLIDLRTRPSHTSTNTRDCLSISDQQPPTEAALSCESGIPSAARFQRWGPAKFGVVQRTMHKLSRQG